MLLQVDEGLVRTLGLNNATIHQIEATLSFARHRPVVHTFEQHILNQAPEMVAFCKENGIAPRAHVCLAKGDVFEAECLQRSDMSPAQAAIKWNVQQGVSACFGVDTLAHIDENFKAATSAQVTFVKVTSLRTQYVVSQFVWVVLLFSEVLAGLLDLHRVSKQFGTWYA